MIALLFFLCLVRGQSSPSCLVSDCSAVMFSLLLRLPGLCSSNVSWCLNEVAFQTASIQPTDSETLFASDQRKLVIEERLCASYLNSSNDGPFYELRCPNSRLLQELRVKIGRIPGPFDLVWNQGCFSPVLRVFCSTFCRSFQQFASTLA
jgi:hypothetical protein